MTSEEYRNKRLEDMSEFDIQVEIVKILDKKKIYYEIGLEGIFLPNPHRKGSPAWSKQNAVNKGVLRKMKASGMKKGPADLKIYLSNVLVHMELKRAKGGIHSKEQKEVESIVNNISYCKYIVCRGLVEAKKQLEKEINESV